MNDVALGELLVRMVVSLAAVLLLVAAAYHVMKRRQGGGGGARLAAAASFVRPERGGPGRAAAVRRGRSGGGRSALRVLGRTGVGRSSNVMAVQFADRVLLVGATDGAAPVLLADVGAAEWDLATAAGHTASRTGTTSNTNTTSPGTAGTGAVGEHDGRRHEKSDAVAASLGLIEALRDATARRA